MKPTDASAPTSRANATDDQRFGWRVLFPPNLVYGLTLALALVLEITGDMHLYGLRHIDGQWFAYGGACLLALLAFGWLLLAFADTSRTTRAAGGVREQRVLALLLLLAWLFTLRDLRIFIAPNAPSLLFAAGSVGALALLALLVWPRGWRWLLALAVLLGSGARLISFAYLPIEPARGDMLPLVQGALAQLARGQSPYTMYHFPWDVPLTYLPLTWLAYGPCFLLGVDMRVTNLCADLAVGAAVWYASRRAPRAPIPLLLWAWVFLLPTAQHWTQATTAPITWALLAWLLALVVRGRQRSAALSLGLCAAATPLAALVALFVLLYWLRHVGARQTARYVGIALGVALIWIIPFLVWSPQAFVFGAFRWFNDNDLFPRLRWEMDNTWARYIGWSGMFWRHNLVGWLKPLQAVLLLILGALFWCHGARRAHLAPILVAAFLLFTMFNPVLWPYLYQPALVAALLAESDTPIVEKMLVML